MQISSSSLVGFPKLRDYRVRSIYIQEESILFQVTGATLPYEPSCLTNLVYVIPHDAQDHFPRHYPIFFVIIFFCYDILRIYIFCNYLFFYTITALYLYYY